MHNEDDKSYKETNIMAGIADIATLVARYNILETMYQQWDCMTLDKEYENSLIDLCVHVFIYLDEVPAIDVHHRCKRAEEYLDSCLAEVHKADAACRGLTVTIEDDSFRRGTKRTVEDIEEEEEEDSDFHGRVVHPRLLAE